MRSFRARLVALIAVTAGVTALSLSLLLLSGENRRLRIESQQTVRSQAEALAIHTAAALRFDDPAAAQETVDAMAPIRHLSAAAVFDRAGTPVARFQRPQESAPTLVPQQLGARTSGDWLLFEEPIRQGRDVIGTVIVAYDMSWQRAALWASIGTALLIAVGAAGIGLLIALPIQRSLSEPVAELVRVAKSVTSRREFSFRARKRADDELGLLTDVFNSMLERIERHDETLRAANERYDLVNRATNEVLRDWDLASDRMHWSGAVEASLGWTAVELDGTSDAWYRHMHPDDREGVRRSLRSTLESEATVWQGEYRLLRRDGSHGHYLDRALITRDLTGGALRMVASMVDVSDRRRAEAAVQEAAARLRTLMNAIPAFVWVANADGQALDFNERWYDYSGLDRERSRGAGWWQAAHPDEAAGALARWQRALRVLEPFDVELRLRRADGTYRWFVLRAVPVATDEGVVGWYGTSLDIEDRKRVERERDVLLDRERSARTHAEQASRTKDEFLATLSHELRTPLAAILGWAQVLEKHDRVAEDAALGEGIAIIERNARAQTHLIEDLLDMSRIESGKLRLDVQTVDLVEVIEAAIRSAQPAADAKEIRVQRILDSRAGPIQGDASRLQQVVWNLLSNAIKFTPRGGRVQVVLQRVDSHLEISVADTGQGMEPEFLPHLFERFRQADASTTRHFGGLGLGLAIVKSLVELHGGVVRARSDGPNQGATFTIELPVAIVRPEPEVAAQRPPAPGPPAEASRMPAADSLAGLRILVVEDDPDARRLVRFLLEGQGAQVGAASSADEALGMIERFAPDVVVSDIGMPGTDGYQFIQTLRRRPAARGGAVPALALTAFARSEDRSRALIAGFEMHLSKPIEPSELIVSVAALARSRRR